MARAKARSPITSVSPDPGMSGRVVYHRTHTSAEIAEAHQHERSQRLAFAKWLRVDETDLSPSDRALCARVLATTTGDGTGYDKALAHVGVNRLFAIGALFFSRP